MLYYVMLLTSESARIRSVSDSFQVKFILINVMYIFSNAHTVLKTQIVVENVTVNFVIVF